MIQYIGKGSTLELHIALPHRDLTEAEVDAITSLTKDGKAPWNKALLVSTGTYADPPAPDDGDGDDG